MGVDRTWLYTWNDASVSRDQKSAFDALVGRRANGEPIAFILGQREFWGRSFECQPSTLIPRPETELLVERSLELALPKSASVLELGTGTGCIAVSIAKEQPDWSILAVEASADALSLARKNAETYQCRNIQFQQSDWYSEIEAKARFDLIVSNPPYVESESADLKKGDVRYEPLSALISGESGLDDIEKIVASAPRFLNPNGVLILEHGFSQARGVSHLLSDVGFNHVKTHRDLAGLDRCTEGVWPG